MSNLEPQYLIAVGALLLLVSLAAAFWPAHKGNFYHRRMRRQSSRALKLLQAKAASQPGSIITYLRKMNPHAVEEIILDAAESAGHKVKRNRAYTGDGGIDGQIFVDGCWHLVQTKRYKKTINPQHVSAFNLVCAQRQQPGLFVHCGRTGDKSRQNKANHVRFISGSALIDLIAGKTLNRAGSSHPVAP